MGEENNMRKMFQEAIDNGAAVHKALFDVASEFNVTSHKVRIVCWEIIKVGLGK